MVTSMDYSEPQYMNSKQYIPNLPFYMIYPLQNAYLQELEYDRDYGRMKELYPMEAKKLQAKVEALCDALEYEGSMMYDEYPDRIMLQKLCDKLIAQEEETDEKLRQLIEVLLYHEMYQRRCKYRRCKNFFPT